MKLSFLNLYVLGLSLCFSNSLFSKNTHVNLFDAYNSALEKTETISIQNNITEQSREDLSQAYGSVLPSIDGTYTYLYQDIPQSIRKTTDNVGILREQNTAKITATQAIFQGGKEYGALSFAKEAVKNNEYITDQTRITLFQNIAQAFYNVVATEQDLADLELSLKAHKERIKDLESWYTIGRARLGDLLLEKSQIAAHLAEIESDRSSITQFRFQLATLTHLEEAVQLDKNSVPIPKKLEELSYYINAMNQRPDIKSLNSQIKIANESVNIAKGGHYPTLNIYGDYYLERTGFLKDSKWDVGVNFTLPLYHGGTVNSQVRQAALKRSETELQLAQTLRNTENSIRALHDATKSGISQIVSYKESKDLAEQNYQEQLKDFKHGLVTNLDVIQALSTLNDAVRAYDKVVYQTISSYVLLQTSVGKIPSTF